MKLNGLIAILVALSVSAVVWEVVLAADDADYVWSDGESAPAEVVIEAAPGETVVSGEAVKANEIVPAPAEVIVEVEPDGDIAEVRVRESVPAATVPTYSGDRPLREEYKQWLASNGFSKSDSAARKSHKRSSRMSNGAAGGADISYEQRAADRDAEYRMYDEADRESLATDRYWSKDHVAGRSSGGKCGTSHGGCGCERCAKKSCGCKDRCGCKGKCGCGKAPRERKPKCAKCGPDCKRCGRATSEGPDYIPPDACQCGRISRKSHRS